MSRIDEDGAGELSKIELAEGLFKMGMIASIDDATFLFVWDRAVRSDDKDVVRRDWWLKNINETKGVNTK